MKVYTLISSQNKKVKNFFLKTVKKLMGEGLIQNRNGRTHLSKKSKRPLKVFP
jgi:hypothetical protein